MGFFLIHIHVASDEAFDEFAGQLEHILDIKFDPEDIARLGLNPEFYAYAFRNKNLRRWFGIPRIIPDDPLEDDGDKKFTHYNYRIEVGVLNPDGTSESYRIRSEFANMIFEALKATNKYSLMMVQNVHPKLDQFDPTLSADS